MVEMEERLRRQDEEMEEMKKSAEEEQGRKMAEAEVRTVRDAGVGDFKGRKRCGSVNSPFSAPPLSHFTPSSRHIFLPKFPFFLHSSFPSFQIVPFTLNPPSYFTRIDCI